MEGEGGGGILDWSYVSDATGELGMCKFSLDLSTLKDDLIGELMLDLNTYVP